MDGNALSTAMITLAGVVGGFMGGKRMGNVSAVETAVGVVDLLQTKIEELDRSNAAKDGQIIDLNARVNVLEGLVTQRADVEAVRDEVAGVRGVVDRIAIEVGA